MTQDEKMVKWAAIGLGTFFLGMLFDQDTLKVLADAMQSSSNDPTSPECVPKICGDESCMIKSYCKHYKEGT